MPDSLPGWLQDLLGPDVLFWLGYLTNGKHLNWYASVQYTLAAAIMGAACALLFGLVGAASSLVLAQTATALIHLQAQLLHRPTGQRQFVLTDVHAIFRQPIEQPLRQ